MKMPADHLQLIFLATTVSPAWGAGWAFTNTTVPPPRAVLQVVPATHLRLALRASRSS